MLTDKEERRLNTLEEDKELFGLTATEQNELDYLRRKKRGEKLPGDRE